MPKDDSFYEDHTNRLWARWERENELVFYDSEEEDRHEQELQALRDQELRKQWASWELEQERVRRWRLLHPPKPVHSSDDEDDMMTLTSLSGSWRMQLHRWTRQGQSIGAH